MNRGARDQRRELRRRLEVKIEERRREAREAAPAHGISLRDPTLLDRALEPRSFPSHERLRPDFSSWLFLQEARRLHPEILEDLYQSVFHRNPGQDRKEALLDWLEKYWLLELWIYTESTQTLCWWEARERRATGEGAAKVRLPAKIRLRWGFEMEMASDRAVRIKGRRADRMARAGSNPPVDDVLLAMLKGTYLEDLDLPRTVKWERGRESPDAFADRLVSAARGLMKLARFLRTQSRGIDSYSAFLHFKEVATLEHYRWLVEKQIEGRSYGKLTRAPGQSLEAARNATQRLAERIGLAIRPAL